MKIEVSKTSFFTSQKTSFFYIAENYRLYVALDWEGILAPMNTEQKWEFFKKTVYELTTKYVPMGNKFKRLKIKPMWLTVKVKKAINNKKIAFKEI